MCTAIRFKAKSVYFGRTLDLEYSLSEGVVITPRRSPLAFRHCERADEHSAMIGIGIVRDGYPLYYDAMNGRGLWMAGLSFPHYAEYNAGRRGMLNIASFELIPYILSKFATISEAASCLSNINLTSDAFSGSLPPTPMHWMLCDSEKCAVIEQTERGLSVHENNIGVLTNSPPFDMQIENLSKYLSLTPYPSTSRFSESFTLKPSSRGIGAFGLPGDVSSTSRFVRAAFTLANASTPEDEKAGISQFFHILGAAAQVEGTVRLNGGKLEKTVYTSCADAQKLVYYYTTYENSCVSAVDMRRERLDSKDLILYPMSHEMKIERQN